MYSQQQLEHGFVLNGKFLNDYSGTIYLDYENKRDSCFVIDNHFVFKGNLEKEVVKASLYLKNGSMPDFYLERKNISVEVKMESVNRSNATAIENLAVVAVSGTKTSEVQRNFRDFEMANSNDDSHQKLIAEVHKIAMQNPQNPFSANLIFGLLQIQDIDMGQVRKIYSLLAPESLEPFYQKFIEDRIFPGNIVDLNSQVFNFRLPDTSDHIFDTGALAGKWFLVDFWATWCEPCRKQLPELKKIYDGYRNKNFEIVGVSIDKSKTNWIEVVSKENIPWKSLIDVRAWDSLVIEKYNVDALPSNFLVNPEGIVVAKNLTPEELEEFLKRNN
jgi:thiol-disulfide isomerase/thioredoxin